MVSRKKKKGHKNYTTLQSYETNAIKESNRQGGRLHHFHLAVSTYSRQYKYSPTLFTVGS